MKENNSWVGGGLVLVALVFVVLYFVPWGTRQWGQISFGPSQGITVTGTARTQQPNQVAQFDAGVTALSDNRETAVNEINSAIAKVIDELKAFGIPEEDIRTSNLSIYQSEEPFLTQGRQTFRPGQWRANNTVTVKLRDVNRAGELADLLTRSGATNVYGPNFMVDDSSELDAELYSDALEDARRKAESLAQASGGKVGKALVINESGSEFMPFARAAAEGFGGGAGVPLEPGSQEVSKSVTVTFELKY